MLRLTPALMLMALPLVLTRLLCFHQRVRPPAGALAPTLEAMVLTAFPLAYFFGFLYYTDVPSLLSVAGTVALAAAGKHWAAAVVRGFVMNFFGTELTELLE
jgi:alpha-1,2-glucosyltransferase